MEISFGFVFFILYIMFGSIVGVILCEVYKLYKKNKQEERLREQEYIHNVLIPLRQTLKENIELTKSPSGCPTDARWKDVKKFF